MLVEGREGNYITKINFIRLNESKEEWNLFRRISKLYLSFMNFLVAWGKLEIIHVVIDSFCLCNKITHFYLNHYFITNKTIMLVLSSISYIKKQSFLCKQYFCTKLFIVSQHWKQVFKSLNFEHKNLMFLYMFFPI